MRGRSRAPSAPGLSSNSRRRTATADTASEFKATFPAARDHADGEANPGEQLAEQPDLRLELMSS
jgi:hypothetical protein